MLNTLVEDTLGIIKQAYEWRENNSEVRTICYNPKFIEFLLNNNLGDNPTIYKVYREVFDYFDKTRELRDATILLFSGGLDSFIAYHMLKERGKDVIALHVNLHLPYSNKELKAVKDLSYESRMEVLFVDCDISKWRTDEWGDTIPCRNLLLGAIGTYYSNEIYLISQRGETSIADRTPRFFSEASEEFSKFYGQQIRFGEVLNMTKQDMVLWYISKGYEPELLKRTVSCFNPTKTKIHCGRCPSCLRKAVALSYAGIDISDMFEHDITKYPKIKEYIKKMKEGKYEKRRTEQTLEVFRSWGWDV